MTALVALLVCLIPTTIGGLLSAIGIAGMDRMIQANVIAMSGRAVEAAGDVDVLLLDKTGTITLGNRQATAFIPADGVKIQELADAAQLASLADETPEGRSIVVLAKEQFQLRERDIHAMGATFVPFTAQTRMSGVNMSGSGRQIRKGAADAIEDYMQQMGNLFPSAVRTTTPRWGANKPPRGRPTGTGCEFRLPSSSVSTRWPGSPTRPCSNVNSRQRCALRRTSP